jgi:hypothetical protein
MGHGGYHAGGDHASREEDHAEERGIMHLGKRIMQREDHASREEDHADGGGIMHLRNMIMQRGDRKRIMQIK